MAKDWVIYIRTNSGPNYKKLFGPNASSPDMYYARTTIENFLYHERSIALAFSRQIFTRHLQSSREMQLLFVFAMVNAPREEKAFIRTTESYYDYAIAQDCTRTFLPMEFVEKYSRLNISDLYRRTDYLKARRAYLNILPFIDYKA